MCGGTCRGRRGWTTARGLSPRVRGNRRAGDDHQRPVGSIPACAGEPAPKPPASRQVKVYPRVCGGTSTEWATITMSHGLSPRVRGNRRRAIIIIRDNGSIPACAGEPLTATAIGRGRRVYPRVCGGTRPDCRQRKAGAGLSPRVRGNQIADQRPQLFRRSIPACAGEPLGPGDRSDGGRVYPRVCGGTRLLRPANRESRGLSPRVRGNRTTSTSS